MTTSRTRTVWIAALALVVAGCGSPAPTTVGAMSTAGPTPTAAPTSSAPAQPKTTEAVTAAAQEAFDRYTSGDFAGAWQMYTAAGRGAVSKADYIRLNTTCPKLQGIQVKIAAARVEGDKATVRAQIGPLVDSYTLAYEGGQWLLEPTATAMADYKQGVDKTIAARKAAGAC
jgi:hypothetical protein